MSTISTTIKSNLHQRGIHDYDHVADAVAHRLEPIEGRVLAGDLRSALVVTGNRHLVSPAAPYLDTIAEAINAERTEEPHGTEEVTLHVSSDTEGFDREYAATVIRQAAHAAGIDDDRVDEVLLQARLIDPEPEPEPENEEAAPSWAQRLIERVESLAEFARSKGYRG